MTRSVWGHCYLHCSTAHVRKAIVIVLLRGAASGVSHCTYVWRATQCVSPQVPPLCLWARHLASCVAEQTHKLWQIASIGSLQWIAMSGVRGRVSNWTNSTGRHHPQICQVFKYIWQATYGSDHIPMMPRQTIGHVLLMLWLLKGQFRANCTEHHYCGIVGGTVALKGCWILVTLVWSDVHKTNNNKQTLGLFYV